MQHSRSADHFKPISPDFYNRGCAPGPGLGILRAVLVERRRHRAIRSAASPGWGLRVTPILPAIPYPLARRPRRSGSVEFGPNSFVFIDSDPLGLPAARHVQGDLAAARCRSPPAWISGSALSYRGTACRRTFIARE